MHGSRHSASQVCIQACDFGYAREFADRKVQVKEAWRSEIVTPSVAKLSGLGYGEQRLLLRREIEFGSRRRVKEAFRHIRRAAVAVCRRLHDIRVCVRTCINRERPARGKDYGACQRPAADYAFERRMHV